MHSPVVPDADFLEAKLRSFLDTGILAGAPERLWVNPDCGLKTRAWEEVRGTGMGAARQTAAGAEGAAATDAPARGCRAASLLGRLHALSPSPGVLTAHKPQNRNLPQVIPSLRNMVAAAHKLRAEVLQKRGGALTTAKAAGASAVAAASATGAAPARSCCPAAGCC